MSEGRREQKWGGGWLGVARMSIAALALGAGTACFDGANAQGLPCVSDEECGIGQSCEQGFCGGPPATSSAGTSSGSSTTSVDSSTGPSVVCGDGIVDEGEDCDPGGEDTMGCDADCTQVVCGDGYINAMAGELCDDGNDSSVDECTAECLPTLFWDDMEDGPTSAAKWTTDIPSHRSTIEGAPFSLTMAQGWIQGTLGMGQGVWHTGQYPDDSGTARLITEFIVFPDNPDPGVVYELHFRHTLRFDGNGVQDDYCMERPQFSDGGIVSIFERGQMPRMIGPPIGGGMPLDDLGGCVMIGEELNPLFSSRMMPPPAYVGLIGPAFAEEILVLGNVAGKTVQIVFEVGFDCDNCWASPPMSIGDPPAPGWVIDDVVIAPYRR